MKIFPSAIVLDTSASPHARLKPVPLTAVTLTDAFWAPRLARTREVTLPTQYQQLEATGRLDNFRRAARKHTGPFRGYVFNDSDVYKWLEAAIWSLASAPHPPLAAMVETVSALILAAQDADGYLNTYFTFEHAGERWTNLRDQHELYCAGHFIQAAIAHARVTGSERLLTAAVRLAEHICARFAAPATGIPGHPEIEMALVELARLTGEVRYLIQVQRFLDGRGHGALGGQTYYLDHAPFRELPRLAGHAVRALYLCAGATDVYAETGEAALLAALHRLWEQMLAGQVYITGGVGARYEGEAFGELYELPNARAYAETCAGIANVLWAWRMLQLGGEAVFAELLETALYNAVLPGISLDGTHYFYSNPLADTGGYRRQPWFACACCPPNVARLLAMLPAYLYSVDREGVWVHSYAAGVGRLPLPDGRMIHLQQHTRYPWEGEVALEVQTAGEFALRLRVPAWCVAATLTVNGKTCEQVCKPGAYVTLRRSWSCGDQVLLSLPMPIRLLMAHPYVLENTGRVALLRGPLLYCLEGVDHPGVELRDVRLLDDGGDLHAIWRPELLHGIMTLEGIGLVAAPEPAWRGQLYRPVEKAQEQAEPLALQAIPYYAWANREPGPMQVWLKG